MAPIADILTFINFIKDADKNNFWSQAALKEWHIPYVFLATCDFPPKATRVEWLRFMFDDRIRTFEDLWIRTNGDWKFLKMRYRKPRSGPPGPAQYIDCDLFLPDPDFLRKTFMSPNAFQERKMSEAFST